MARMTSLWYNTGNFNSKTSALLSTARGASKPCGRSTVSNSTTDSPLVQLSFEDEQWRDIPGYEGLYQVSDLGHIWSIRAKHILKPYTKTGKSGNEYLKVTLWKGRQHYHYVHALVALVFIGSCPIGYEVDHINMQRGDNRLANLRYLSRADNVARTGIFGFHLVGEKHPRSILSDVQRLQIVALYAEGKYSQKALATMFGTSTGNVWNLLHGINSSEVTGIVRQQTCSNVPGEGEEDRDE